VLGFYLVYAADYYQSRGAAGERTAPPNDAATHAYMTALWVGALLWVTGVAWWTRGRERQRALLVPVVWAALSFVMAVGLTYYGMEIAEWK
jgi:hypothetical protein